MIPSCVDKSFYQCKNNIGNECCVEICGDLSGSINKYKQIICDSNANPTDFNRHQFALSKMFDNKRKYIDHVVANVLRQVVDHISLDCLHKLSCCLPQKIEEILRNVTDIDSDRLIRILVTDILQSYGNSAGQVTDWYVFANSIKPSHSLSKINDNDNKQEDVTMNKPTSRSSKNKKSSDRILKDQIKSIFDTTPVSPSLVDKKRSSESIAFNKFTTPSTDPKNPSMNQTPSNAITPQMISTTNTMTPMSTYSKETYTPIGTKYQSRTKRNQDFISNKTNEIDNHESLPFHKKSELHKSSPQHRKSANIHHYDHKSNKGSDQSLCSDCVLTIQHKHKRSSVHQKHDHHIIKNFDTLSTHSSSSQTSVPINKLHIDRYKQNSGNASSIITDIASTSTKSSNSINVERSKLNDLFTDEQILLFKLFASSDNAVKYLSQNQLPTDNEDQSLSSNDLEKMNLSLIENRLKSNFEKKTLRFNHYPNMLADFD
ncbi:unnamed protein product [Adineta steineri]|uniref:Uncharacterized protein n=1 Tax=Adineta steineri TaxID=433720 RepID=A0A814SIS5_9BILA|nr:unnamed protein product [Adineta steineri]CAF3895658.1 unnamed protein product [Adineta steineri]